MLNKTPTKEGINAITQIANNLGTQPAGARILAFAIAVLICLLLINMTCIVKDADQKQYLMGNCASFVFSVFAISCYIGYQISMRRLSSREQEENKELHDAIALRVIT